MDLIDIKKLLSSDCIQSDMINPMIDKLSLSDIEKLSVAEKDSLREILSTITILVQYSGSGAHLDNPEKAANLLDSLT